MSNPFDQFVSPAPAPRKDGRTLRYDAPELDAFADEVEAKYGLPPGLVRALKNAGERSNSWQVSPAGARGVMQFMPQNIRQYGVTDPTDPYQMIDAAGRYLRDTSRQYNGNVPAMIADYNGGPRQARRVLAGQRPAAAETAAYLDRVTRYMGGGGGGGGGGGMPAPLPASNPFDQFDEGPSVAAAVTGPNPFDQFEAPAAPDFSNVQVGSGSTDSAPGLPALPGQPLMSGNGNIPRRPEDREVGAIYTDKRGVPRRWLGDSWAAGDAARETTFGEMLQGGGVDLVQGLTRAPEALADLLGWVSGGESLLTPEGKAAFESSRQTLEQFKPEAYRAEQAVPIVQRDKQGGIAGVNLPSGESVAGTILQSIPQIPQMIATGGGLRSVAQGALPNAPKLASVLGYGTANAGMVAPGIAEQARTEALKAGATPEEAQAVANKAMAMAVPLTMATGGVGEGLAAAQGAGANSLVSALLRGALTEAPTESIEEAGTSAIGDIAQGRQVNAANALESGIMAAFGGGIPGATVAGTEYVGNRNRPAAFPSDQINVADIVAAMQPSPPSAVATEGPASPRQGVAPVAPPTSSPAEKQEVAPVAGAPSRPDMAAATRAIDTRLAALEEAGAGQIDEAEVSALNAERQELDDLLREQDRAKREGLILSPEARLSPQERATADARRQEIVSTLERHRAARTAADQAQRLRDRLENTDTDAALYEVAREIDPTLGTAQAEAFRSPQPSSPVSSNRNQAAESFAPKPAVPPAQAAEVAPQTAMPTAQQPQAIATPAPSAPAPTATPSVPAPGATVREPSSRPAVPPSAAAVPRAEAQREPMAETGDLTNSANPPRTTSLKNAVTDAERVAEGRDPIIRAARKGNRETVDEAVAALRETPTLGRETAARLAEGGPVELKDEAVLLVHKVDLRKRRDAAAERAQNPNVSEEARAIARREYDDAVQQIDEVDQAASRIGTESGRLLQLRRRMIAEDYSLPALERKLRMVVNRDLKPAEQAEIRELADKVATLQRKLDAVESQQASAQVAEMLARLMSQSPGKGATLAQRRAAAAESKAALSAMASARGGQQSVGAAEGRPGQARAALAERLGRGVVARLERAGVLVLDERNGGTWDGTRIGIGNVAPENALGVLLHEVTHANMLDVLGEQGYERALRDLDALEAAGDPLALKAKRRADRSGETGQRLDDERIAYMVEEATNAAKPAPKVTEFVRSIFSAFRRWAATSAVFRALERIGVDRPTLKPADFVAFARKGLDRMVQQARQPVGTADADRIRKLETELRTDYKTGIRNQRAFDEDADLGWEAVAAMDMDGLKKINDQLGHDAGDAVLRALANELAAAETTDARFYRLSGAGDEFAGRFKTQAGADRMMAALQNALDGLQVDLDVADADGRVRYYTYQGIGISYGTGADYGTADTAANQQKADRLAAGIREAPRADGPSRRIRESAPRPGGRREGDPPAEVTPQRSIPEGETDAGAPVPAGADPVAFFHLARVGAFHYADGARDLASWTARMESDLGAAADRYRSMLPDAFNAAKAQASRPQGTTETVAEAVEAVGDQRRPRDVKRVVRAVVAEGVRGEDAVISAAAQALDMDDADVRTLFVQSESQARTLTEAQAELKSLRQQLREAQRPDPETRYQDQRARDFERRIAELEARIAAGDFAKREKTERDLIERNKRLQFDLEKTKERFHKYALEAEFQSRTPVGKIFGETVAGINFARAIMTSLDLSAVLRQGGKITLGHPIRAAKAFPGSLRAFVSEDADFRIRQEIESRPNAPLYKKYGLELTGIGGDALSRTEEAYASRWVDKLPGLAGGGLIRGSGRSYTAFLNRLRADSFDAMLAALARDGSNPTKEEGKAIANYVNVATGRGKVGKNEKSGEVLNTVFFAPRLVASRFQLLAGQPLYGGSNRTRKMITMEYARFLIGVSVAVALAMQLRDEDDETKAIELDPRSANFGKVRFGDTFLDPLAGLAQVTVFLARVLSGETRTTKNDELKPLRDTYRLTDVAPGLGDGYQLGKTGYGGRDVPDVIASFLRSKLAPVPGAIINVATGKNMIGETVTPVSAAGELVTPMSVGNIVDVLEAQGMARGTAINLLGILGMAVQYRKSEAEQAAEDANGIPGAMGFGTAEDLE